LTQNFPPKLLFSFLAFDSGLPDFSWYMVPQPEKNVPNKHKMYHMVIKYPKCPINISNGHTIFKHFPIKGLPKFTQIGIFGLKINHLATPL
jgi:hypothetical protein